jgi:hypothetical protein
MLTVSHTTTVSAILEHTANLESIFDSKVWLTDFDAITCVKSYKIPLLKARTNPAWIN